MHVVENSHRPGAPLLLPTLTSAVTLLRPERGERSVSRSLPFATPTLDGSSLARSLRRRRPPMERKKYNKETSPRWRLPPLGAARVSVRAADERLLFPLAVPARTGSYPRMRST